MIFFSGLVVCLLVLTAEAQVGYSSLPSCAETKECLLFDLICKTDNYEVRRYGTVQFAITLVTASNLQDAQRIGFPRLTAYFNGSNDKGVILDSVAPALERVPRKASTETGSYVFYFILPSEYQQDPPTPTDDNVQRTQMPSLTFYVASYRGWNTDSNDQAASASLARDLDSAGANYLKDYHISAIYNKPVPEGNMYNEVAFIALDDPVC